MLAQHSLSLKYIIFAQIATIANICAQHLMIRAYSGTFDILTAVMVGTGVGLVVKYLLDKHFIFKFHARSVTHSTQTFALYTLMGLATTVIFWGFEFGFHHIFETKEMRYLGGVIGLAIGYLAKYHLDKRYVFRTEAI